MSLVLPLLAATSAFLLYRYVFYPIILSPLRSIPFASPLAFTPFWIRYHQRNGSQALPIITRAHAQHGPIIRLGPNEISVTSLSSTHKLYIEKGGFAKPKWFADMFTWYGVRNMVSMQGGAGSQEHKGRKRDLGGVYGKSLLMGSEELKAIAVRVLGGVGDMLRELARGKGEMDVFSFNGAVSADFASAYLFGQQSATNFVGDLKIREEFFEKQSTWLKGKPGGGEAKKWLEAFGLQRCSIPAATLKDEEKDASAIVYNQLNARGLEGNELASETLDHLIAGAEGPRTTLTYLEWELSKNALVQSKLRAELKSLPFDPASGLPDFKALDALPLLDAVLTESMRVYTLAGGPQYRITPPEGATLDGVFVPGGVQVSASFAILHKNENVFPEPEKWDPERWLADDKEKIEEMRKWFWGFAKGSRVCVGKDFAVIGKE
jgi:hypothetical protein